MSREVRPKETGVKGVEDREAGGGPGVEDGRQEAKFGDQDQNFQPLELRSFPSTDGGWVRRMERFPSPGG